MDHAPLRDPHREPGPAAASAPARLPGHHPRLRPRRAFADLVRHQLGYLLLEWVRQAEQDAPKPMQGFAGFLRQDLDAVTTGLTLPGGSGVVEGHVNRVKKLKRAMYGRASFELLRTRILTQLEG
ncbi:transposase [Streptomyces sp. NPDC059866]|uniref:transposase n=1 Tax=Streptomyces sp. NPDC059866 TaxID=3346978 RepID=UPI0036498C72